MIRELDSQQLHEGERVIEPVCLASYISPLTSEMKPVSLTVTNFRLIIKRSDPQATGTLRQSTQAFPFFTSVSLGVMATINSKISQRSDGMSLHIICKDFRDLKFTITDLETGQKVFNNLKYYSAPNLNNEVLFAYEYGTKLMKELKNEKEFGWDVYDPHEEFNRQNIFTSGWKESDINAEYKLCDTYPSLIAIPNEVTRDDLLKECSTHRSKGRIPVLSWLHPESKASLTRASQPLVGLQGKRCESDEKLIGYIRTANANANCLLIFDARPQVNAVANKGRGGGIENPAYYEKVQYIFLNIKNIHSMRSSQTKIFESCFPKPDDLRWFKAISDSKWLYHLKQIIFAAVSVSDKIENHKTSILIHCSDGWDRTSQITSLAMLMLDPYYRTIKGFQVLIEKEWISFGHKFIQRTGGLADGGNLVMPDGKQVVSSPTNLQKKATNPEERSPVFLQFLDCVWQIIQQFPHSFEFNDRLLITILDELYAGRFGTFLFDNQFQAVNNQVRTYTVSLWFYINQNVENYKNPLYTPAEISGHRVIFPQHALAQLSLWKTYYLRWHPAIQSQDPVTLRDRLLTEVMHQFRQLTASSQTGEKEDEKSMKKSPQIPSIDDVEIGSTVTKV